MRNDLTRLECSILALAASGHANKQIGLRLSMAEKTVRNHFTIIFDKLHVNNRTVAVIRAFKKGYIDLKEIA